MNNTELIKAMLNKIQQSLTKDINIMEVCGTHTNAIARFGIRTLVEPHIHLLSGPGCPVCVTPQGYIDATIELLEKPKIILTTFGDMLKVNGSQQNLAYHKSLGKDIRILYSPLDALTIAIENKSKEIVFLAVGFETTAPIIAATIKLAKERQMLNISFLIGLKTMSPILHHILSDKAHSIDGLICPGHVAAIKGADYFKVISEQYDMPAVITGFEALDIVSAIYYLVQHQKGIHESFTNLYKLCVTDEGNVKANRLLEDVFTACDSMWRGIGNIQGSGLSLTNTYQYYDAQYRYGITIDQKAATTCICGEILLGKKLPYECELFGSSCTPEKPIGPCMVSTEGCCGVFYKYRYITNKGERTYG